MTQARFVADVGGTNIRLAQENNGQLSHIQKFLCNDFADIAEVIQGYFGHFPELQFTAGCIGIACPVDDDWIKMTNHHWQFSVTELKQTLGLEYLAVINDYTAIAMSLPVLTDAQKSQVGGGSPKAEGNIAVFGPGTGLGVGHLVPIAEGWRCLDGEGGHVDFTPVDEIDMAIWRYLKDQLGHVSAEEIMSGRGLVQLYQAMAHYLNEPAVFTDPADITENGVSGACSLSQATLGRFCAIMGTFAGNLALNLGTHGGVYIAGGIAPRFVEFLQDSDFRARFEAKGRFKDYVAAIPTYVVTEPEHGLLGAAAYLEQHFKGKEDE